MLMLLSSPAYSEIIELYNDMGPVSLNGRMDVLRDPSGRLTVEDVAGAEQSRFISHPIRYSAGFTKDTIWLRFTVQKTGERPEGEWWLEVYPPFLDHVTLYEPVRAEADLIPGEKMVFRKKQAGKLLPVSAREIADRNFVFVMNLPDERPKTFYLQVRGDSAIFVDAKIWDAHVFGRSSERTSILLGGFYGIAILILVLNLIFWLILRDRLFIIYAVFIASLAAALLNSNGLTALYVFPELPALVYLLTGMAVPCVLITGTMLIEELIPVARQGFWRRSFIAVRIFSAACLVLIVAGQFRLVAGPMQFAGLYVSTACVVISFIAIYRRVPSAKLYGITFIIYYLGGMMITIRNTNIFGLSRPFMDDVFQIGTAIHMVLIQIAIAYRFYHLELERKDARKKIEYETVRAHRLESVAALAGGIAHDFNNMLTVIMSTTTLAKMYAEDNQNAVAKLEDAEKEIMHARELTTQLLTFAKGGAPVKRLSSFRELLHDTVEFSLAGSNVSSEMIIPDDLWSAEIDRIQISQVISNLMINARQSMPQGGTVTLRADNVQLDNGSGMPLESGRYVRIAIQDRGAGISPDDLPRIFDPFFTTKSMGSGLGLSTSYSIVSQHGGYIDVVSSLSEGSTFTVYLPASSEIFRDDVTETVPELKGSGRVLLMDDDEDILKNVGEMASAIGYETETARNGEEALILFRRAKALSRPFDVVVLDMTVIGGMGGRDCMTELLKTAPDTRAIAISGYAQDAVIAEYGRYGFPAALAKPFTIEELHKTMMQVRR